jgi:hypothetical protein
MREHHDHSRCEALWLLGSLGGAIGLASLGAPVLAADFDPAGAFMPGKG